MSAFAMYLLKASICLIAFYALYVVVFKNTTFFRFNRCYLLFSLLTSFVIPVIHLSLVMSQYEFMNMSSIDTSLIEYNPLYYPNRKQL